MMFGIIIYTKRVQGVKEETSRKFFHELKIYQVYVNLVESVLDRYE